MCGSEWEVKGREGDNYILGLQSSFCGLLRPFLKPEMFVMMF